MSEFVYEIVFLIFAAVAGVSAFVPRFAPVRRKLLWTTALLVGCALLWRADGPIYGLNRILPE
jgi:hypothetical protein